MSMNLELPEEIVKALGPKPEHEALEAILLFLVSEERISVARAGEILGLDRVSAIRWYTSHGFYYPELSEEDLAEDLLHARKP
jgi:predicted HTH domain antitoxin